mmetsp:Transcript_3319/g.4506  ORF Transcript_3319/g.4506 Transcript_3319/m.4506 type:complete len:618 (-) Transcript_3319:88-1941(-)
MKKEYIKSLLLSIALLATDTNADDGWITASTDTVTTGQHVSVSWELVRSLDPYIDEAVEECYDDQDGGASKRSCTTIIPRGCFVAEYTPAGANIEAYEPEMNYTDSWFWAIPFTNPAPAKYIPCRLFSDTKGEDVGTYNFTVTNRRATFEYALFDGGFYKPRLVARTGAITFTDAEVPMHKRVAFTNDVSEMRVSWTSNQDDSNTLHYVKWGHSADDMNNVVTATTSTYESTDLCYSPATDVGFVDPGFFHTAVISSLPEATEVFYAVGSDGYGFTSTSSFVSATTTSSTTDLLLTGDMGITYADESLYHWPTIRAFATATHLADFAETGQFDAALHVGDIAYATGYSTKWDRFMEMIEPVSSILPYMTCMGNHERDWVDSGQTGAFSRNLDSGGECGVPTAARFVTPTSNSAASLTPVRGSVQGASAGWYSFNLGVTHIVMMNTEFDLSVGSEQYEWLASDLASVDRTDTPWVIVGGHRQLYSCTSRNTVLADALEPLFMLNRVDVVVVGHIHVAQRTCPIVNGTCVEEPDEFGYYAPVHAVVGNAGLTASVCKNGFLPDWGTFEHGFATLAANETNLDLKYFADCDTPVKDTACRGQPAPLLHEYNMVHTYPRGY